MCISDQRCIIFLNESIWPQSTASKDLNAILSTPVQSSFRRKAKWGPSQTRGQTLRSLRSQAPAHLSVDQPQRQDGEPGNPGSKRQTLRTPLQ